ncbi:MAG: shikimate dehydrogenase [Ktedonobacterales bacterium]|nr:shikimate dehydrogenase [Ktedonobacterales bacterium]
MSESPPFSLPASPLGAAPQVIGLIGFPVGHSLSPAMQQAALDAIGFSARYELWDTPPDALAERVAVLRTPGMLGANVTIPHKAAVMPLLDAVAPEARRHVGAVNTIVREQTGERVRLIGYNTDLAALLRVLDEHDAWVGPRRVLVLGAGGAAQAALGAALLRDREPWVAARHPKRARAALEALWAREYMDEATPPPLPREWRARALDLGDEAALGAALAETGLLVNATPVGTRDPQASPIELALLRHLPREAFIFDLVYHPPETALVRAGRAAGLRAAGGLLMLLYQGAAAFTLWTQREAPLAIMRAALDQAT